MKAQELIVEAVKYLDKEKDVFVTVFKRDSNGYVIGKIRYPVSSVFGHTDKVDIYCEESESIIQYEG